MKIQSTNISFGSGTINPAGIIKYNIEQYTSHLQPNNSHTILQAVALFARRFNTLTYQLYIFATTQHLEITIICIIGKILFFLAQNVKSSERRAV